MRVRARALLPAKRALGDDEQSLTTPFAAVMQGARASMRAAGWNRPIQTHKLIHHFSAVEFFCAMQSEKLSFSVDLFFTPP